jgi:hypothetical protein
MKRSWNISLWIGFAFVLLGAFGYLYLMQFPATRDFPWLDLVLFAVGGWFLAVGLKRAFASPQRYRGKTSGVILSALGLAIIGLFCYGTFVETRGIPSAAGAPRTGATAPDFTLSDAAGRPVTLAELLKKNRAVLLIFYRGFW